MDVTRAILTISGQGTYPVTEAEAWSDFQCPSCRNPKMLMVAFREGSQIYVDANPLNKWLLCVGCGTGAVADEYNRVSPSSKEYPTPEGTPTAEAKAWTEIRECLSVGAYNAVAMLCRKLLLHMVFTHQRSVNPEAKPGNINFAQAVQYLLSNRIITAAYEPLATEIRHVGNRANHELPDISEDEARKIALFTHYLFVSVYEIPKKAKIATPFVGDAAVPFDGDLEPDATEPETVGE